MRWSVLLLLVGCGSGSDPATDYPPSDLDPAFVSCAVAADCVALELGCCDECNGGFAVAVRSDKATEVAEQHAEVCRNGHACTEIGCAPWVVDCVDEVCAMERGSFTR